MHKTKAAAAGARRVRAQQQPKAHKTTVAAAGARRLRALSSSQKHVLFPLLHSAGLPWLLLCFMT